MRTLPGVSQSLWLSAGEPPGREPYGGGGRADVAVIGAGIVGAAVALELAKSGSEVILVEARRVASGVTGSSTAKVTALHEMQYSQITSKVGREAASAYATLNLDGVAAVAALAHEHEIDCSLETAPNYP